jgi:hypothetical protein
VTIIKLFVDIIYFLIKNILQSFKNLLPTQQIWAKQGMTIVIPSEHNTSQKKKGEVKLKILSFRRCFEFHLCLLFENMRKCERF